MSTPAFATDPISPRAGLIRPTDPSRQRHSSPLCRGGARAAIGATYELSEGVRLVGKAGWFHISNAQTGPTNPGLDSVSVMIGLSFTLGQ